MPTMIVEFQDVSATMRGTVIKVDSDRDDWSGYYYFDSEYMEQFDGGSFDLEEGRELPDQIGLLPEEERELLREDLFPADNDEEES
jgi:hypothetical protein